MAALALRAVREEEPNTVYISMEPLTSMAKRNRFPVGCTNCEGGGAGEGGVAGGGEG